MFPCMAMAELLGSETQAERRGVGRAKHNSCRTIVINFLPVVSQER